MRVRSSLLVLVLLTGASAFALPVLPSTYAMPNGSSLGYTYWDDAYTGVGCKTCDGAALSGGLGELTDGVVATASWNVTEPPPGPGPYVGWVNLNPTIAFHFNQSVVIDSVTFNFDDAGGLGSVGGPASVIVSGITYAVVNPPGSGPFSFTVSGLGFTGTDLSISIIRSDTNVVTMVSEISFASAVPEPGSGAMLLAGLAVGAGLYLRRRSSVGEGAA